MPLAPRLSVLVGVLAALLESKLVKVDVCLYLLKPIRAIRSTHSMFLT